MTKKMIDNEELNSRHGQYNLNKDWLICYTDRDIDEMLHLVKEILCDAIIDRTKDGVQLIRPHSFFVDGTKNYVIIVKDKRKDN